MSWRLPLPMPQVGLLHKHAVDINPVFEAGPDDDAAPGQRRAEAEVRRCPADADMVVVM